MAKIRIHTTNGLTVEAPFEAWLVAVINSLPTEIRHQVFHRVTNLQGASIIPDKYLFKEDALGTIHMVERPVVDLGGRV